VEDLEAVRPTKLLTFRQTAADLGITPAMLYELLKDQAVRKLLRPLRLRAGRGLQRFRAENVEKYLRLMELEEQ
jgi:predicted DNA-binding transcriptional regulator AlpA